MKLGLKKFISGILLVLVLILPGFSSVIAADYPQPVGFVNDFAGILSADFRQNLETDLSNFEKETKVEIAVVTIDSLQGDYLENYAVKLFEQWGIGKKDQDNGILLLIVKDERKIRIEVGYGLEPVINDARAGRIIRDQMSPNFKKGDYDVGIRLAVGQIEEYIRKGESPIMKEEKSNWEIGDIFTIMVFGIIFMITYLSSFWARSKRIWPGGIVGGVLGGFLGLFISSGIFFILFAFGFGIFGFILDLILSRNYKKRILTGKPTSFWHSWGGFSGGGGGGGGFGGFGGGSSGGGGASGGW